VLELLEQFRKMIGPDRFRVERAGCLFVGLNSQIWGLNSEVAREQFEWLRK